MFDITQKGRAVTVLGNATYWLKTVYYFPCKQYKALKINAII